MKKNLLFLIVAVIYSCLCGMSTAKAAEVNVELKVLQFNVWHEGTRVSGGFDAIVNEIVRCDADLVALSEVRNFNGANFTESLVNALNQKGLVYYQRESDDSNLISKYPIISHSYAYELANDRGSITKSVVDVQGAEVAFYSAHLDYTNYACYLPRGYSGTTWEELPAPVSDLNEVLQMNENSFRDEQIQAFITDALTETQTGRVVIMGGDFNEPSFKDWTDATKDMFDHNGLIVPWHSTVMLEDNGFIDAYRALYPNPITHPGFTWPADNKDIAVSSLTWAPKADERDRIDYVYHYPDARLELNDMVILGPKGSIVESQRIQETSDDMFLEPLDVWPSDHKAVLATYTLTTPGETVTRITSDKVDYTVSESITFNVVNGPGNSKDWVGIYTTGTTPSSSNASIEWGYVVNNQVVFSSGISAEGTYDAVLLENDGFTELARLTFTVVPAPAEPQLVLSKSEYSPSETISMSVIDGPGNVKDWVGLYPKGTEPGPGIYSLAWAYVENSQVTFANGLPDVGEYEAFLCENDGNTILARALFNINTSTGIDDPVSTEVTAYPNPTYGQVTITIDSVAIISNYTVYSKDGITVMTGVAADASNEISLDLSSLTKGLYIVMLLDTEGREYSVKVRKK